MCITHTVYIYIYAWIQQGTPNKWLRISQIYTQHAYAYIYIYIYIHSYYIHICIDKWEGSESHLPSQIVFRRLTAPNPLQFAIGQKITIWLQEAHIIFWCQMEYLVPAIINKETPPRLHTVVLGTSGRPGSMIISKHWVWQWSALFYFWVSLEIV